MANAYSSSSSRHPRPQQTGPSRAIAVQELKLEDIPDYQMRVKVSSMKTVLPSKSIKVLYGALMAKKGREEDAMESLMELEDPIMIESDKKGADELSQGTQTLPRKMTAKQQVNTKQTIQEKYAAKAAQTRESRPSQSRQSEVSVLQSSPTASPVQVKPKRRLVQGRKRAASPELSSPPSRSVFKEKQPAKRQETPVSISSEDSNSETEVVLDTKLDGNLLKFFNTCSVANLSDTASIQQAQAEFLLSHRPFRDLGQIKEVSEQPAAKPGVKKRAKPNYIGERIVEICERMWIGYIAIDQLVKECEDLVKPVAEAMKKWGVDVFGKDTNGEFELVSFDPSPRTRFDEPADSGMITPKSLVASGDENDDVKKSATRLSKSIDFFPQPSIMAESVILKDYQVVGINWLSLLFNNDLSCILADDMGLGKTCQVIAFLAHLHETNVQGPHIIVVPSSVLENWLREFDKFCPTLRVRPYHDSKNNRPALQEELLHDVPDVIITTYALAKFLRALKPCACIFDEGHALKTSTSNVYRELMKIPCRLRLLLTGTPLQNNLGELASLLGFILPKVFAEHKDDLEAIFNHKQKMNDQDTSLLSAQRIARARSMMTPFILRRKKHQVLKHLPTKTRRVEYCEMTPYQAETYQERKESQRALIVKRQAGEKIDAKTTNNMLMYFRKIAISPLLVRKHFTDKILRKISVECRKEEEFANSNPDLIFEDLEFTTDMEMHRWCEKYDSVRKHVLKNDEWMDSGKVQALVKLVREYKEQGDRVLVFSQFTMVLDVLEEVLETIETKFMRLDGQLDINLRQDLIDQFHKDQSITVFMLSTKAGGAGINLACANKVVIFDGSFNPQDDIQAENRAHRVGQARPVEVVRLVTRGTIEEQIYALGKTKLALDERVAGEVGDGAAGDEEEGKKVEKEAKKVIEEMMMAELKEGTQGTQEGKSKKVGKGAKNASAIS